MLAANVERNTAMIDNQGWGQDREVDWSVADAIHPTHLIKRVHGDTEAIFCERCAGWTSGGSQLCVLRNPCPGVVPKERGFRHRLLQMGVVPRNGAKMPSMGRQRWQR